jgi:hypothetical protein
VELGTAAVVCAVKADRIAAVGWVVPLPVKLSGCGVSALSSLMLRVALYRTFAVVGVKVTVIVQDFPAPTLDPQVFVVE